MREQEDWRIRAACRHMNPELFFPEGTTGPALEATGLAKQICGTCPVRARCLDWALGNSPAFGIWGGLSEGERRDLRHRLAEVRHGPGSQCA
jgi:WhiB family redox-sensing transcriptional regulator